MAYPQWHCRDYADDFEDEYYYHDRTYAYGRGRPVIDMAAALEPLLVHLRGYDAHRVKLEQEGGRIGDLQRLTEILRQEIPIPGHYKEHQIRLINQVGLRDMLRDVGDYRLHLGVRQLDTRLPVYYLCRLVRRYRSRYDLVLEDLYMSPGYPLPDERFVNLMRRGHELYHLRLSPYRQQAENILGKQKSSGVDDLLSEVGKHIFQAAWHDDQRLGVMVAQHFKLPAFLQAIEVLYLCLSGELCEIRTVATDQMFRFFEVAYPQPAIYHFLKLLLGLEGGALTGLIQQALALYSQLSQGFNRFLTCKVRWGFRQETVSLQKLVFGNFSRLSQVAASLKDSPEVREAKELLESASQEVVAALLGPSGAKEESHACSWCW
jgi:hypothetical protein